MVKYEVLHQEINPLIQISGRISLASLTRYSGFKLMVRHSSRIILFLVLAGFLVPAPKAQGLVRFDFEQKYFSHPQRQVWDFSIIRPDSVYHLFYHTILDVYLFGWPV